MKKKALGLILGMSIASLSIPSAAPMVMNVMAEEAEAAEDVDTSEEAVDESAEAEDAEADVNEAVEELVENGEEAEAEEDTEFSDFVEGSAVLSDYDYEAGELTEDGWRCEGLDMQYVPEEGVSMGISQNDRMNEYHERNGLDKMIAVNELVATREDKSYIQMMVEVNPNAETEEEILERFAETEGLSLVSDSKELEIGGRTYLACTGVANKEKYLLAVDTDTEGVVSAIKIKYTDTAARKSLIMGFGELEELDAQEEEVAEAAVDEEIDDEEVFDVVEDVDDSELAISTPEEFEDAAEIEVVETETEAE